MERIASMEMAELAKREMGFKDVAPRCRTCAKYREEGSTDNFALCVGYCAELGQFGLIPLKSDGGVCRRWEPKP